MQRLLTIFLSLLIVSASFGQTRCELLKQYLAAGCIPDSVKADQIREQFRKTYPDDYYTQGINYMLAYEYEKRGEIDKARELALLIVNHPNRYTTFQACTLEYSYKPGCRTLYTPQDFVEVQYNAAVLLFDIYTRTRQYDSALHILRRAETEFFFHPHPESKIISNRLLNYSLAYENLRDTQNALEVLIPYLRTYPVVDRFVFLLKKYGMIDSVRSAYRNIEDSLIYRYDVVVGENPVEIYEMAEDGRLLRKTTIEEYGREVSWRFMGVEFLVASAHDYKSHRAQGEKGRRKLQPVKTSEQLLREAKDHVQSFHFYKQLYQ